MREIVLDTETTGFEPSEGHRIVEIGAVELFNHLPTGRTYHQYINPERGMPKEAFEVHGLGDDFLRDKPLFKMIGAAFLEFIADAQLVIHNAAFDLGFLDAELARLGKGKFRDHVAGVIDSLLMAREMFPGKSNSLDALCRRLEVDNTHRTLHGALMDAELLAEVYINMTRGQDALLIDAGSGDGDGQGGGEQIAAIDYSQFDLRVVAPTDEEAQAFEAALADLDKASGGKALWKSLEAVL